MYIRWCTCRIPASVEDLTPCIILEKGGTSSLNMVQTSVVLLSSLMLPLLYDNTAISCSPSAPCKVGEEYSDCGVPCQPACDNFMSASCITLCMPGCVCIEGTRRNDNGECVEPGACCRGNTTYAECGNDCPNTCAHMLQPNPTCPEICFMGCFCKPGYVRMTDSKQCVLPQDCPKIDCLN
ncbi:inducible metalloproteinase inhibitor protein-like isoform X2 [Phyllobates terribilis]|uniref:inducible metalloproteinase inhibitor protein-like isoform X2 n=1 Tax=Phyllobates terribilis TaxID=111132 RepID=UPI003CCAA8E8